MGLRDCVIAALLCGQIACGEGSNATGGGAEPASSGSTTSPTGAGMSAGGDSTGDSTGGATGGTSTSTGEPTGTDSSATSSGGLPGDAGAFNWVINAPNAHEYGRQTEIPLGFGEAEFTFTVWIRPDASYGVGPQAAGQLELWIDADNMPYSDEEWWFDGNFLLDGHNNNGGALNGTFSLQMYGGGRIRWLFGDGEPAPDGGHWGIEVWPASSTPDLLDDQWHQVTCVRRFVDPDGADLELWVDGALLASEYTPVRTDMRVWWDDWPTFGGAQAGWFWGAEKQAAIGVLAQYEDYKGLVAEQRFWSQALDATEIQQTWDAAIGGGEFGLVGWYPWTEGAGTETCDALGDSACIDLFLTEDAQWDPDGPPLQ